MLKRARRNPTGAYATLKREGGFTTLQLIITLAPIAIASTFAVVAIGHSRSTMRLSASERGLGAYLEQARTDSIRCVLQSAVP
jgi:Tfp pilus assembly protein FimT